jgi:hypothetical protein
MSFFSELIRIVNLPYTIFLGIIVLFWLTVIIGFFDMESLDGDADFDIDVDGDAEADLEKEIEARGGEGGGLAAALNMGAVPLSLWMSIFGIIAWVFSLIMNAALDIVGKDFIHNFFRLAGGAFLIIPFSALLTKLIVIPLKPAFRYKKSVSRYDLVMEFCRVTSSNVSETFGLAEISSKGSPIIVNIRARETEKLKMGDKALITGYDSKENIYTVKRFDHEDI